MLRPSRPMIRPFMSSEASSTTLTVVSAVWLAATRWRASATSARARRFASVRASSSSCRTVRASSWRTRSSERSRSCLRASPSVSPPTRSSSRSMRVVAGLQILLELPRVRLAVGDPLLAARQLLALRVELGLALVDTFLDLRHLQPAVLDLGLDLGAESDRLLARLDLGLAAGRLGLTVGVGEDRPPLVLREPQPRRARRSEPGPEAERSYRDSDHCCDDREHGRSLRGIVPRQRPRLLTSGHRLHGGLPVNRSCCVLYLGRRALRRARVMPQVGFELEWMFIVAGFRNALCAGEMSDEASLS